MTRKLDVSLDTARDLVQTMRRTQNKPHLREALAGGVVSFDRIEALSRIEDDTDLLQHLDVAGVRRVAADRVEVTADDEIDATRERFLFLRPSLDESWWDLRGGLDGVTGAVIDRALNEKPDQIPPLPDGTRGSVGWRRATALYELASGGQTPQAQVIVFIDANKASPSAGRAGIRLEAGPRVGAQAIANILCDATAEITVNGENGENGRVLLHRPGAKTRTAALALTGGQPKG